MRRIWWLVRYGGIHKVPLEVLRRHFDKQIKITTKELAKTNRKIPKLMKEIWRRGGPGHQERLMHLLRESAGLDESFEIMKRDTEILLKEKAGKT